MKGLRITALSMLMLLMTCYILVCFYLSKPTYIDNCNRLAEKYDYISVPTYEDGFEQNLGRTMTGVVLQVDSSQALVKMEDLDKEIYELGLKHDFYRVVGKATIYHKINIHFGFNLIFITQILAGLILILSFIKIIFLIYGSFSLNDYHDMQFPNTYI